MKANESLKLIEKFGECPLCGNHFFGGGEGSLSIDENAFERICKCGCKVSITLNNESEEN